jgi:hypothetical protein
MNSLRLPSLHHSLKLKLLTLLASSTYPYSLLITSDLKLLYRPQSPVNGQQGCTIFAFMWLIIATSVVRFDSAPTSAQRQVKRDSNVYLIRNTLGLPKSTTGTSILSSPSTRTTDAEDSTKSWRISSPVGRQLVPRREGRYGVVDLPDVRDRRFCTHLEPEYCKCIRCQTGAS